MLQKEFKHVYKKILTMASGVSLILSLFTLKTIPSGPVTEYSLTVCSSKCFIDTTDCFPGKNVIYGFISPTSQALLCLFEK